MSYIGNTSTTQAFTPVVDFASGNGSTTAYTLSRPVASVAQVQVTVANVPQNPTSAYTISGQTLTFTSAPPSGTNNIYVYYTSPITQTFAPAQGTVNANSFASSTGSGSVVLATSPTITSPTMSGAVVSAMASSVITSGTAQASTSGTSIDFTGIPSWVKRISVLYASLSSNGTSDFLIKLGTSGGIVSSGYLGSSMVTATGAVATLYTTGFGINQNTTGTSFVGHGMMTISALDSATYKWVASGTMGESDTARGCYTGGSVTLSGVVTQLRFTTVNGTDTFDAGSINILYE
jgi:hypothetical protein